MILLGIFLVVERLNIRRSLFNWLTVALRGLERSAMGAATGVANFISNSTTSDVIGYVLILGALIAIVLRLRWRLLRNTALTTIRCPACNGEVHRVHRHRLDHLVSAFVPVRRYRCTNRECLWDGIRIISSRRRPEPAHQA